MAVITVEKSLSEITSGNTTDNTIKLQRMGLPDIVGFDIKVTSGTILWAINADATGGISIAAGESLPKFAIRNSKDVIHFKAASAADKFILGVIF